MMIQLRSAYDRPLFVNPREIVYMEETSVSDTYIALKNGNGVTVSTHIETVAHLIEEALRDNEPDSRNGRAGSSADSLKWP